MTIEMILLLMGSILIGIGIVQNEHGKLNDLAIVTLLTTVGILILPAIGYHMKMQILVPTLSGYLFGGFIAKRWDIVVTKRHSDISKDSE